MNVMHSQGDRALRQLWGIDTAALRGPKPRWALGDVAAAAVALADEAGLDGVSLKRVAQRLGLTTTALYRYVDSRAVLVELMVDASIGDPPQLGGGDWRQRARAWSEQLALRYAQHPWMSEVAPTRMPCQPRVYAWIDALVGAIAAQADVDPLRLALLLDGLVRCYTALGRTVTDAVPPDWLGDAVAARFPRLAHAARPGTAEAHPELLFAVDAVLRGVG